MSLVQTIERFVEEKEWEDEVEFNEEAGVCRLSTRLEIAGQVFELDIYGEEKLERMTFCLTPPFRALATKRLDCCMLFNYLNEGYLYTGRLSFDKDGRIICRDVLDTDDIEPEPAMIHNMLRSGSSLFNRHIEMIAAVAVTGKTFDEVLAEYEKTESLKAARDSGN